MSPPRIVVLYKLLSGHVHWRTAIATGKRGLGAGIAWGNEEGYAQRLLSNPGGVDVWVRAKSAAQSVVIR